MIKNVSMESNNTRRPYHRKTWVVATTRADQNAAVFENSTAPKPYVAAIVATLNREPGNRSAISFSPSRAVESARTQKKKGDLFV